MSLTYSVFPLGGGGVFIYGFFIRGIVFKPCDVYLGQICPVFCEVGLPRIFVRAMTTITDVLNINVLKLVNVRKLVNVHKLGTKVIPSERQFNLKYFFCKI